MSDTKEKKTYTVEDMRGAFINGFAWTARYRGERDMLPLVCEAQAEARRLLPSPKKLREVQIDGDIYRAEGNSLFIREGVLGWRRSSIDPARIRALNGLLDNPFEKEK